MRTRLALALLLSLSFTSIALAQDSDKTVAALEGAPFKKLTFAVASHGDLGEPGPSYTITLGADGSLTSQPGNGWPKTPSPEKVAALQSLFKQSSFVFFAANHDTLTMKSTGAATTFDLRADFEPNAAHLGGASVNGMTGATVSVALADDSKKQALASLTQLIQEMTTLLNANTAAQAKAPSAPEASKGPALPPLGEKPAAPPAPLVGGPFTQLDLSWSPAATPFNPSQTDKDLSAAFKNGFKVSVDASGKVTLTADGQTYTDHVDPAALQAAWGKSLAGSTVLHDTGAGLDTPSVALNATYRDASGQLQKKTDSTGNLSPAVVAALEKLASDVAKKHQLAADARSEVPSPGFIRPVNELTGGE